MDVLGRYALQIYLLILSHLLSFGVTHSMRDLICDVITLREDIAAICVK